MAYSKAYQEVIAGRVREDEQIAFYGQNDVAVPGRVVAFVNQSAREEPVIAKDFLNTDRVGKRNNTVPALDTYVPAKVHTATT